MKCPTSKIPVCCIPAMLFLLAATPLVMALISQYGFKLSPCHLCIWQRIPYVVVMGLAALAMLARCPKLLKAVLFLSALAFFADAAIALLHTGVERQWWQGRSWWGTAAHLLGLEDCSGTKSASSIDDLRAQLMAAPVARCDQPQFMFLGLSMASWNGLYALGAMFASLKLCCKLNKCGAEKTDDKA